jgi:hypothetical protein
LSTDVDTSWCTYTWIDGNTYTSSNNIATHTLLSSTGCDSIVTLDLTINNIDTSVTNVSGVFTSNQVAATYQWYICNNSFIPISGATSQSFTPPTNGSYAVVVSNGNNCSDTSLCILINNVSMDENTLEFNIHPNPTNGEFVIEFTNKINANVVISNYLGQIIKQEKIINKEIYINLDKDLSKGLYFVKIINLDNNSSIVEKLIFK